MRITACVGINTGTKPTGYFKLDDGRIIHEISIPILVAYGLLENADEIETFRGEFYREQEYSLQGAEAISILTEGTTYRVIKGDGLIAGKDFAIEDFEVPEGIKFIGKGGFQGIECLRTLVIPSSVEYIEEDAFNGCRNLVKVTFNKGLKAIHSRAFANTALEAGSVVLPDTVEVISAKEAFPKCAREVYVNRNISNECIRALTRCGLMVRYTNSNYVFRFGR